MTLPLQSLRYTTAELLACALCELFPDSTLVDMGVSDINFHYDIILKNSIDNSSLKIIEERMRHLAKKNNQIKILEMMRQNASQFLSHHDQKIRAEAALKAPQNVIQILQIGDFVDLATGNYLSSTSEVKYFKLQTIQQISPEITRITGTAFFDNMALKQFLKRFDEAQDRDHRILGPEMCLYTNVEDSDCWFWHPNGTILRNLIKQRIDTHYAQEEFDPITASLIIPSNILSKEERAASCHCDLGESNFSCCPDPTPLHARITTKSLKEHHLPKRNHSFAQIISNIDKNQICGLLNSRNYETDLAHIFCKPEQVSSQLISSLQFIDKIIKIFGFEYQWYLNARRPRAFPKEKWDKAVKFLTGATEDCGIGCILDKDADTRYGPRVEIRLSDALTRLWAGPYVELDLTHRVSYRSGQGKEQEASMITLSCMGSVERFIALIVELYSGNLPFWLAPEQVRVIAVGPKYAQYAADVCARIRSKKYRVNLDSGFEGLSESVRDAERARLPYMVLVGDKETKKQLITVRFRNQAAVQSEITLENFLEILEKEVCQKETHNDKQDRDSG